MKRIFTVTLCFASLGLFSQSWDVPQENKGLVTKITASWCGPCGSWGWDAFSDLVETHKDNGICMALYASSSSLFYTSAASVIADEIGFGGYPNFAANGEDQGVSYSNVSPIIEDFVDNAPVKANAAYEIAKVTDDSILINVKAKFFQNSTGTYLIAAYLIEDHVVGYQNGQGDSAVHHMVFRGAFSEASNNFELTNQGASEGEEFTKTLYIERDDQWDLSHVTIATVIWASDSLNPSDLIYVNGTNEPQAGDLLSGGNGGDGSGDDADDDDYKSWPVGLDEVQEQTFNIYPNPVSNNLFIEMSVMDDLKVELVDLLGKTLVTQSFFSTNKAVLDMSAFPQGVYMLKIQSPTHGDLIRLVKK
ncbi:MAG: hypothetical protein Kow0075_15450 [Salibacteraceae bacterium]